jgi:hypothetical protein
MRIRLIIFSIPKVKHLILLLMLKVDIVLLHPFNLANQLKLHIGQVIILTVGISSQVYQEIFISMKPLSVLTIINKRKN